MIGNMSLGSLSGAFIPLMLKKFGRDPAQSSSIFLTGITDTGGFFIFLSLAAVFLI
jgi:magnesium transporter